MRPFAKRLLEALKNPWLGVPALAGMFIFIAVITPRQQSVVESRFVFDNDEAVGNVVAKILEYGLADKIPRLNALTKQGEEYAKRFGTVEQKADANAKAIDAASHRIDGLTGAVDNLTKQQLNQQRAIDAGKRRLDEILPKLVPMSQLEAVEKEVAELQANFRQRSTA